MTQQHYKLAALHMPAQDDELRRGHTLDDEFYSIKLSGPYQGSVPTPDSQQCGIWWTPEESEEKIKQRIYDMVMAVVQEFKETK